MIKIGNEVLFKSRLYTVVGFEKDSQGDYMLKLKARGHKFEISLAIDPTQVEEVDNDIAEITPQDLTEYMNN